MKAISTDINMNYGSENCARICLNKGRVQSKMYTGSTFEDIDIKGEWIQIKAAIIESANEVIQTQATSNRNEWWDESYKLIVSQKNEARKKYLQVKTRATREIHEAKRTEANRICREKKRI